MLEIYTTTTCPHCKVLKRKLHEANISFIEKDTVKDELAFAEMIAEDIESVPCIKWKDKFYPDITSFEEIKRLVSE